MIIENVAASFPARKVSNEEVVDLVRSHSRDFDGDLHKTLRVVKTLLDRSGLITRNWRAEGERPIDHVANAVRSALQGTVLEPRDIDLFIYVGIGGGFREPANSYLVAKSLGFVRAECFDVIDACMSWTRAVSLVDSLFKTGQYRNAMIVNAEFNMTEGGPLFPANFQLTGHEELEHVLPSYTIGEAATATLLLPDSPGNFRFTFHSKPELADLCTIPMAGFEGFCELTDNVGKLGAGRFSAMGAALHHHLGQELPHLLKKAEMTGQEADIVFTHSSSSTEWNKAGQENGFAHKIFHTYPSTGNIVSASIPVALAEADGVGRLKKGQRVMFLMGSAGMSFAACTFVY
jgi:3-oxoacyl-[acyl-carrier-protein] synthase III